MIDPNKRASAGVRKATLAIRSHGYSVDQVLTPSHKSALVSTFVRAHRRLAASCKCRVVVKTMFHTTTVESAKAILEQGFKTSGVHKAHGSVHGLGVNLSPVPDHTLIYTAKHRTACTLVCAVAIGRWHANEGSDEEVYHTTKHSRPRKGFDAMHSQGGMIVVVPSSARVLPIAAIVHTRNRALRPGQKLVIEHDGGKSMGVA